MMKYCVSYGFSPQSFIREREQVPWHLGFVYSTEVLFVALGLVIILKMCQLCSKAFSYSNFHIHEAYKFYTLALVSTIVIISSRAVQLYFGSKLSEKDTDIGPYKQGWHLLNEMMGLISVYTVNLMYTLNSLTWLMIASKCDFNDTGSTEELNVDEEYDEETKKQTHRFYVKFRNSLLYGFLPGCMILAIIFLLMHSEGTCIASKLITSISNFLIFVLMFYSLAKILWQRSRDPQVPKKVKNIWTYILVAMTLRQLIMIGLTAYDLADPIQDGPAAKFALPNWAANMVTFFFGVFITTVPIFLLSYLADKQLEVEKQQIDRTDRIVYSSTII